MLLELATYPPTKMLALPKTKEKLSHKSDLFILSPQIRRILHRKIYGKLTRAITYHYPDHDHTVCDNYRVH